MTLDDQSDPSIICLTQVWIPMFQILHYLTWLWWWVFLLFFGCMLINSSIKVLDWSILGSWAWLRHRCIFEASWSTCVIPCCKTKFVDATFTLVKSIFMCDWNISLSAHLWHCLKELLHIPALQLWFKKISHPGCRIHEHGCHSTNFYYNFGSKKTT